MAVELVVVSPIDIWRLRRVNPGRSGWRCISKSVWVVVDRCRYVPEKYPVANGVVAVADVVGFYEVVAWAI